MKIVAISDTHNRHDSITIPECDVLIHAGDATGRGTSIKVMDFALWFNKQPATYKIFIPGNHELLFQSSLPASKDWFYKKCPNGILLINESFTIPNGPKIYGTPVTPFFHNWAWNEFAEGLKKTFEAIPEDTDILVSHGPAYCILDKITPLHPSNLGCAILRDEILNRVKPKIHICGHIHGSGGKHINLNNIDFYNVAICDEYYDPINPITIIDYEHKD